MEKIVASGEYRFVAFLMSVKVYCAMMKMNI